MVPGGIPGMALLPQQPGAPPIMVPIIPSTGAHLMAQQQQIRLAVAHAQAAAAAQTARVRKTDVLSNFPNENNFDILPSIWSIIPKLLTSIFNHMKHMVF